MKGNVMGAIFAKSSPEVVHEAEVTILWNQPSQGEGLRVA